MTPNILHVLLRACVGAALAFSLASAAHSAEDFSPAERALFMTNQLAGLRPPMTLRYTYNKSGSLEEGFNDAVNIHLRAQSSGDCCTANADFLTGARRLSLPEIEAGVGNPVLLYFLERDIREMSRLTKGQMNYFRKRIRMAVFQGAQISDVNLPYRGKTVAARQITITPYTDDPLRVRFEKLANKRYTFIVSDAVPGGVVSIRTRIAAAAGDAPPLILEEMLLDGAAAAPRTP